MLLLASTCLTSSAPRRSRCGAAALATVATLRLTTALQRGATIIYATHIFDGLEAWPTHAAYVERGQLKRCGAADELPVRAVALAAAARR